MEREQGLQVYKVRIDDTEGVEVEKVIIKLWNTARLPRPSESGLSSLRKLPAQRTARKTRKLRVDFHRRVIFTCVRVKLT